MGANLFVFASNIESRKRSVNFIYSIAFKLAGVNQITAAEKAANGLENSVDRVNATVQKTENSVTRFGRKSKSAFDNAAGSVKRWVAGLGIGLATLSSINIAAADDATNIAIDFGTSGNGIENLKFINELTDTFGLNLQASKEGFKQLSGSLRGTNLEGAATRDIFKGVALAGGAMRLSADQIQGAYLAIGQIASKGKVQAEELRGQLGERIPGAFKIAADAMGVTQAKLNKMLETGKVTAEDFLPKFAAQLEKTFGGDAARIADSPAASIERFKNSVFRLQVAFGTYLLPTVQRFLDNVAIPAITIIEQNIQVIQHLAVVVGAAWLATKVYTLWVTRAAIATKIITAAQWLWNAALTANPIGLVVAAIAALAVGVIYAWNQFRGFRGFIVGMWEVIKELGRILFDFLIKPFQALGKVVIGALTFDKKLIESGLNDAASLMQSNALKLGKRIGDAYRKGFNSDAANSKIETPDALKTAFGNTTAGTKPVNNDKETDSTKGLSSIVGRHSTKHININLGNLIGEFQIVTNSLEEGVEKAKQLVERELIQSLNISNQIQ